MNSRDERILHRIKTFKEEKRHKSHQQLKTDIAPTLLDALEMIIDAYPELDQFKKEIIDTIQSLDIVKLKRDYEAMKLCCSHQAEEIARLKEIEKMFNNSICNADLQKTIDEQQKVIIRQDAEIKEQSMRLYANSNYISALEERCNNLTNERDNLKRTCESKHNRIIELENKLSRQTETLVKLQNRLEVSTSQLEKQLSQFQIEAEKYRKIREILK